MRAPDHRSGAAEHPLFLAGPPTGPELWREVVRRLGVGEARGVLDPARPTVLDAGAALAAESDFARRVVVAHGLAVPVAIAAALRTSPRALVLSNGPLRRLDVVTRGASAVAHALPVLLSAQLLRPSLALPALASSLAFRRLVVNPYVMDRDTVALLCGPLLSTPGSRRAFAVFLSDLRNGLPDASLLTCPVYLVWGDADPLNPASEADWLDARLGGGRRVDIPGGRLFHPEERPWAIADVVAGILSAEGVDRT